MKELIVFGPQLKQLIEDHNFSTKLNATERRAWLAFEIVCRNFLDCEKGKNYCEIVQEVISSYSAMGCNLSLQFNGRISVWTFPEDMRAFFDDHGQSFRQDVSKMEKRCTEECSPDVVAGDTSWRI